MFCEFGTETATFWPKI